MSIAERLQYIVEELFDGNKAAFARAIGIAPTSISNYLGKDRASKPSSDILEKIVNSVEKVNAYWLLTGKEKHSPKIINIVQMNHILIQPIMYPSI